eukprot:scaffold8360_cov18-Tisochrysis_lutea.AAC.2
MEEPCEPAWTLQQRTNKQPRTSKSATNNHEQTIAPAHDMSCAGCVNKSKACAGARRGPSIRPSVPACKACWPQALTNLCMDHSVSMWIRVCQPLCFLHAARPEAAGAFLHALPSCAEVIPCALCLHMHPLVSLRPGRQQEFDAVSAHPHGAPQPPASLRKPQCADLNPCVPSTVCCLLDAGAEGNRLVPSCAARQSPTPARPTPQLNSF